MDVEEKGVGMKITFVSGGSLVWGTMLLTDLALMRSLHGATIALQDVDQAAPDLMAGMARKIPDDTLPLLYTPCMSWQLWVPVSSGPCDVSPDCH
jgi:hypothetical protein